MTVALTLYFPILTGRAIDLILDKGNVDFPGILAIAKEGVIVIGITAAAQWIMNMCNNRMTYNIVRDIRRDAFERIEHLPLSYIDSHSHGDMVSRIIADVDMFWEIVPESDSCEIYTYMAGGGCSLPGKAMVLMPGAGYEGVTRFVLDQMTSYGLNACPPLLVGIGVATSVETAALLSKKALMRPIGSHNPNARAAEMENLLEDGINSIGLGPQGMSGCASVMGVHIENTARHPSTIGVAVNVGCWLHRRGLVRLAIRN